MRRTHSFRWWLILFLTVYILVGATVTVTVSVHTLHNLQREASDERRELLEFYMQQSNATLDNAYYSLIDFNQNNEDVVTFQLETRPSENALCKTALRNTLQSLTTSRIGVTGYFLYVTRDALGNDFFTFASNGNQTQVSSIPRDMLLNYVQETVSSPGFRPDRWTVASLNGQNYLVCFTYSRNSYIGCYINMNNLIRPLDKVGSKSGYSFFTDGEGRILTDSPLEADRVTLGTEASGYRTETLAGGKYTAINAKSSEVDVHLVALIDNSTIFADFAPLFANVLTILLISVILLPVILSLIWSIINRPLSNLLFTFDRVKRGDPDARATTATSITEMATLNRSFNEMMDEVKTLKISVYEHQLKERQTYLDYLQIQIHPHFFLNCLNLVYSLAELKSYDKIKELSLSLTKYFRYLFHRSTSVVSVREELDHVQNYINIHRFRFPGDIEYCVEMEEGLEEARIPPISIQTFVENSIKHARDVKKTMRILIRVERHEGKLRVSVRDNGKGFPPDILISLNAGKRLSEDEIHRIGLTNVRERINLLFGDDAFTRFYNNQGSVSEFNIPLLFK